MKSTEISDLLTERGYEVHERARGRSGACHLVASKPETLPGGRIDYWEFLGVKLQEPDVDRVQLILSVTGSALASEWVQDLMPDGYEKFLLKAGLIHFRKLLKADDSGRSEKIQLDTSNDPSEFATHWDPHELEAEVSRVQKEVLELLWQNLHGGIKRTLKQVVEDSVCTSSSVLDQVLSSYGNRGFIRRPFDASGMMLTAEGEAELERLRLAQPQVASDTATQVKGVFISYRRDDTKFVSPMIYERLVEEFSPVFVDVDSMPPGDFPTHIDEQIEKCNIFLAVIGEKWLNATDDQGRRRLDLPEDYVRLEIEFALKRDIFVIPLLVDTEMPSEQELPKSLKKLALLHKMPSRYAHRLISVRMSTA